MPWGLPIWCRGCPVSPWVLGEDGWVLLGSARAELLPARPGLGSAGGTGPPCLTWTGSLLEARRGYTLKQNALKIISLQQLLTLFTRPRSAALETLKPRIRRNHNVINYSVDLLVFIAEGEIK